MSLGNIFIHVLAISMFFGQVVLIYRPPYISLLHQFQHELIPLQYHFVNHLYYTHFYMLTLSILLILAVQFHANLIHRQCFDICITILYCGSRHVSNFLVLNLPCKGTCIIDGNNISSP